MKYLLLTHIPALAGQSDGVIRWDAAWLADLSAECAALREAGFEVTVATPLLQSADARWLARQSLVDVRLRDAPYTYLPLPGYRTMAQFLAARSALRRTIKQAAARADIVQIGPGGHPVSLGQTAWASLSSSRAKRIVIFADDPIPAWRRYAHSGKNPAKRLGKSMAADSLARFCAKAIREADLVFAHSPVVEKHYARAWNDHCHTLPWSALRDSQIGAARTPDNRKPLRILCFGDPTATRGVDHIFRAVAKARRLSAKIELDLAGDLTQSADLMNLLRAEKLEPAVRLLGAIAPEKQLATLDRADLLVSANLVPTSDPIICLAAARGLPIVSYVGESTVDSLTTAGAGKMIPRGDTNLLAQALLDLATDRKRVAAMSERAIAWAKASSLDAIHRRRAEMARQCCEGK